MKHDGFFGGLKILTAVMIFLLVLGWLQNIHPAFDGPSHFRLHLVGALLLTCVILLIFRCWAWFMAGLLASIVSLFLTLQYLPGFSGISAQAATGSARVDELRVVQANIYYKNANTSRMSKVIAAARPDVILLQEVTRISEGILSDFATSHPHQVHCHREGIGSVAILSRFPLGGGQRQECLWTLGFARAEITVNGKTVDFASFHSRWPWPFSQPRQLAALGEEFDRLQHPLILAGDFNAAPWSSAVQLTAERTGTKVAPGLYATWNLQVAFLRRLLGPLLPIDHIMISSDLRYLSREVLADGGSDHYPVLTRIQLQ